MKTHYAEPSVPTLTTTTDPEHTCPWGKTHLSHARFSRREWGQSLRCPRSVGCTTATNDEPPETAKATCKLLMSLLKSLSKLLTLASLNSFHSLEYMTQTLVRFMVPPATAPAAVPDGIFVRDSLWLRLASPKVQRKSPAKRRLIGYPKERGILRVHVYLPGTAASSTPRHSSKKKKKERKG